LHIQVISADKFDQLLISNSTPDKPGLAAANGLLKIPPGANCVVCRGGV